MLDNGVETGFDTDDDAGGEEKPGTGVEEPTMGAVLELARSMAEELATRGLEELAAIATKELVGTVADELWSIGTEELRTTTRAEEVERLTTTVLLIVEVEVERTGPAGVALVVAVLVEVVTRGFVVVELVVLEVRVAEVAAGDAVNKAVEVAFVGGLLVVEKGVLIAVS